jgi:hypothetical protein
MAHREGGVPKIIVYILIICTATGHAHLPVALRFREQTFENPVKSASEFIILLSCSTIWPAIVEPGESGIDVSRAAKRPSEGSHNRDSCVGVGISAIRFSLPHI